MSEEMRRYYEDLNRRRMAGPGPCCDRPHSDEGPHYFNGIGER